MQYVIGINKNVIGINVTVTVHTLQRIYTVSLITRGKKTISATKKIYIYCLEIICTAGRVAKKSVDQIIFEATGEGIEVRASPQ